MGLASSGRGRGRGGRWREVCDYSSKKESKQEARSKHKMIPNEYTIYLSLSFYLTIFL
jgi:hypothetical protein